MIETHKGGGMTITGNHIYLFSMMALIKACEMKAKHGIGPSSLPSVARLRERFGITAKTYSKAAQQLSDLLPEPNDEEGLAELAKMWGKK